MSAPDLIALAERCEAATGPDRNLDADIMRALGCRDMRADFNPTPYTASIDAAMTLVPEGWDWAIGIGPEDGYEHYPDMSCAWASLSPRDRDAGSAPIEATSYTAATALCAAALRARASQ